MGPRRCSNKILWRRKNCQELSFYWKMVFCVIFILKMNESLLKISVLMKKLRVFVVIFAWNRSKYEFWQVSKRDKSLSVASQTSQNWWTCILRTLKKYPRIFLNFGTWNREFLLMVANIPYLEKVCSYLLLDTVKHLAIPDFEFRRFPGETRVFFSKIYFLEVLL